MDKPALSVPPAHVPEQDVCLVYSTFPSMESAEQAAQQIVAARLAACANILPGMVSIYEWNGAMERGEEVVLLLKTLAARADELVSRLDALHPYDVPAIVILPATGGLPAYLEWVSRSVTQTGGS
ncbi:divalent-cation tolerance protein CutA [Xanthobacter sp. TB0136]|uniref:divalent-cation tolerance protein CutA n=1 Tax=Xanthobacter sp. TB0136 TaxID=3459177 RepID=UPI0040392E3F